MNRSSSGSRERMRALAPKLPGGQGERPARALPAGFPCPTQRSSLLRSPAIPEVIYRAPVETVAHPQQPRAEPGIDLEPTLRRWPVRIGLLRSIAWGDR